MLSVFLRFDNSLLCDNFRSCLVSCGVNVVDGEAEANYVLAEEKDTIKLCLVNADDVLEMFSKPVDFRDVVSVFRRINDDLPLWKESPLMVNFSMGILHCVAGKFEGKVVKLTDLQQKLFRALVMTDCDGMDFDDLCISVYGKDDVWARSNLDMVIYNLNKRYAGVFDGAKIVVKDSDGHGKTLVKFVR